ncbi:MAG TPA: diguanylate cyclase [Myxococcota bacterium]|jgi:diguanylate cyclase (GGDEF)-like protein|nr:diguanylate cyclase [Myxococcota bacterium]
MRVLVADDDVERRRALERRLEAWGYPCVGVSDGAAAASALARETGPRVALMHAQLPEIDGLELCRELRQDDTAPYTYVILFSARDTRADLIGALRAGADDYLVAPIDPEVLQLRLRAGRRIVDLQEQLVAARDAMRFQNEHDALTGLPSRSRLSHALETELERARRFETPVAVLMCDVDHFHQVNAAHGHAVGDYVLRAISVRLRAGVRRYDTLGRYGGEEFAAVLPGCDRQLALEVAERLRGGVAATPVDSPAGLVRVTVSIGVATSEVHPARAEQLLAAADAALYRAKRAGRNRVDYAYEITTGAVGALGRSSGAPAPRS